MTIYFTCPFAARSTEAYELVFYHLAHRFKDDELIEARAVIHNSRQWAKKFPDLLERLDTFIFMLNAEGFIGRGVWIELFSSVEERGIFRLEAAETQEESGG